MVKKTVVIADSAVISAFKALCRKSGRVPSKVIEGWMITFVQQQHLDVRKTKASKLRGKMVVS